MNRETLMKQFEILCRLYETGEAMNNEWYSVGMEPPAENVTLTKSIWRKMTRMAKQLKIDWD